MKKLYRWLLPLIFTSMMLIANIVSADPPPPDPGGNPGGGGIPVGSPIDGETWFLLVLVGIYCIYKIYEFRKNQKIQKSANTNN